MRRICFRRIDQVANVKKLKDWFRERGYTEDLVNKGTRGPLKILYFVALKHLEEAYWEIVELRYP